MNITRRRLLSGIGTAAMVGVAGCTGGEENVDEADAEETEDLFKEANAFAGIRADAATITCKMREFPHATDRADTPVERVALGTDAGELVDNVPFQYGKLLYEFERPEDVQFFRAVAAFKPHSDEDRQDNAIEVIRFEVTDNEVRALERKTITAQ